MAQVKREAAVKGGKQAVRARQTRLRMLDAAGELFVGQGYGATTLQEIADRAGVAVQTVYFTFGNKRKLLKELVDTAVAGDDEPLATMERPWFREVVDAPGAAELLERHVSGVREVLGRVAGINEVVKVAAATDPQLADVRPYDGDPRYAVQLAVGEALVRKPGVRGGLTAEHAADVLFGLLSPELYLLLVRDRGWPGERWERWALETLRGQLCR